MSDTDPYMAADAPNVEVANTAVEPAVDSFNQPVVEKPVEAPVTEEQTVPEGSIKEVLAWVGEDATKAQTALTAEKSGEKRTTLITKLSAIID
jgi:hypothetical protein